MDRFVVDNSVIMAWCFEDENNDYTESILSALKAAAGLVPSIWPLEITNVLLVAERRKRLSKTDSTRFLSLVNNLPIQVIQEEPERITKEIFTLARDQQLSSYDASYLDLAIRHGLPLATQDEKLRKAAHRCKVPIAK